MDQQTKQKNVERIAEAFDRLPENKAEFLMGYAEGVIAASDKSKTAAEKPA